MSKTTETTVQTERDQFLALLQEAPPRQSVDDPRYWAWKRKVDALLVEIKD